MLLKLTLLYRKVDTTCWRGTLQWRIIRYFRGSLKAYTSHIPPLTNEVCYNLRKENMHQNCSLYKRKRANARTRMPFYFSQIEISFNWITVIPVTNCETAHYEKYMLTSGIFAVERVSMKEGNGKSWNHMKNCIVTIFFLFSYDYKIIIAFIIFYVFFSTFLVCVYLIMLNKVK